MEIDLNRKSMTIKHYVVRCERASGLNNDQSTEENHWRFILIDPHSSEKSYFNDLDELSNGLISRLAHLFNDPNQSI